MTADEVVSFPLFARLGRGEADVLAQHLHAHRAQRGDVLFWQGDEATHLYLIQRGQVKMELSSASGTVTVVEVLGPKTPIAAANFLAKEPYPLTARALTDVEYATLAYVDFERLVRTHHEIALTLITYLASRLHQAYHRQGQGHQPAKARLAGLLVQLADGAPRLTDTGRHVPIELSHEELAQMTGLSRETVSRHLSQWRQAGWLSLGQRRIEVVDASALKKVSQETED